MSAARVVRVLIIDPSRHFRQIVAEQLALNAAFSVVQACDAFEARDRILSSHPDVILLDLELPKIDGIALLRQLRDSYPVPVFMWGLGVEKGGREALQAMSLGALDVLIKPRAMDVAARRKFIEDLAQRIISAARDARPFVRHGAPLDPMRGEVREAGVDPRRHFVAIGASTGGPEAVRALLRNVPSDFPPTAIVQHMPVGFVPAFAERLDRACPLRVTQAVDGQVIQPGEAVVARGDTQLTIVRSMLGWECRYTNQVKVNGHCPSVEPLFDSVTSAARAGAVGVLLTGMGEDGAVALGRMRAAGGLTFAQSRETCVVYGMPKGAVERGAAMHVLAPEEMPTAIIRALAARGSQRGARKAAQVD